MGEPGKIIDKGKTRWDLLPLRQVGYIADVMTQGQKKYPNNGWKNTKNGIGAYLAAALRHIEAWQSGKKFDDESGCRALAHAAWNLLVLMWFEDQEAPLTLHSEGAPKKAVWYPCFRCSSVEDIKNMRENLGYKHCPECGKYLCVWVAP